MAKKAGRKDLNDAWGWYRCFRDEKVSLRHCCHRKCLNTWIMLTELSWAVTKKTGGDSNEKRKKV